MHEYLIFDEFDCYRYKADDIALALIQFAADKPEKVPLAILINDMNIERVVYEFD